MGDDAIACAMVDMLQSLEPAEITVLCGSVEETSRLLGVPASTLRRRHLFRAVSNADLCICGGGGIIDDGDLRFFGTKGMLATFFAVSLLARLQAKPLAFVAVGAERFRSRLGRFLARTMLDWADLVTVRDSGSKQIIDELRLRRPARLTEDAALLFGRLPIPPNRMSRSIGVVVQADVALESDFYVATLASALYEVAAEVGASLRFIPMWPADREAIEAVAGRLGADVSWAVDSISTPHEAMAAIAACDLLVGSRLHSLILSAIAAVPFVGVARQEKVKLFARRTGQLCVDGRGALDGAGLTQAIRGTWQRRERHSSVLRDASQELRGRSRDNVEALREMLIDRGFSAGSGAGHRRTSLALGGGESKACVVCLSPDVWGEVKRPQQLMSLFARRIPVIYVEPPVYIGALARRPLAELGQADRRLRWALGLSRKASEPTAGLHRIVPVALVPDQMLRKWFKGRIADWVALHEDRAITSLVSRTASDLGAKRIALWFGSPERAQLTERIEAPVIYDCVDRWSDFPGLAGSDVWKEQLARDEATLLDRADWVFCSSGGLLESKKERAAGRVSLLRNGADFAHFSKAARPNGESPKELGGLSRPIIGYVGAVAEWIDFELLRAVARSRPHWSIVLVGPVFSGRISGDPAELRLITDLENIHVLGPRPYQELPDYLRAFDVSIIPFKMNGLTQDTNPIKVYEYLAAGKPVVSTPLPEVCLLRGVSVAGDALDFARAIEDSLSERWPGSAERIDVGRQNSWEERAQVAWERLESLFERPYHERTEAPG